MHVSYTAEGVKDWFGKNKVQIYLRELDKPGSFDGNLRAKRRHADDMIQWCEENCSGDWLCDVDKGFELPFSFGLFDFSEPNDALIFKLRWG